MLTCSALLNSDTLPAHQLSAAKCRAMQTLGHRPLCNATHCHRQNYVAALLEHTRALQPTVWGSSSCSGAHATAISAPTTSSSSSSSSRRSLLCCAHSSYRSSNSSSSSFSSRSSRSSELMLTEPISMLDVDKELWEVLDLCSDEELETIYDVLFGPSPFSPVVKSMVKEDEPPLLQLRGRTSIMHKIESRFRFLAADSTATMRGKRPSYREALLLIRDRLEVQCSSNLTTPDLEAEIFLHVLQNCVEYVQAEGDPDPLAAAAVAYADGDGMSSMPSDAPRSNWTERLTAPFKFGGRDLLPSALKLGSAVTITAVMRRTAAQLGRQLLGHHARYQAVAKAATSTAAQGMLSQWQRQAALSAAQRGLTSATLRYSAVRGALSFIGPMMWAWLAFDLVRAAVGTDYARVVRAVYIMAQVRLVATQGWSNPEDDDAAAAAATAGADAAAGFGYGNDDADDDVHFS